MTGKRVGQNPRPSLTSDNWGKAAGFTLLELMVVIAVIIILLSLTIPAVTGLTKSSNLNSGARLVANLLSIARSEAINRRTLIRFEVATYWPNDTTAPY